ncbi:MAG: hypothetical protein HY538_09265 [Deltaproteobacteria bacterium]|nr:hypothetical protein [Deltaproteobacteria bacterium]
MNGVKSFRRAFLAVGVVFSVLTFTYSCGGSGDESGVSNPDEEEDDPGTAEEDTGDTTQTDDSGLGATLSSIQENIFTPNCASSSCHAGSSPQAGLNLSDGKSFENLVGVSSQQVPSLKRVESGDSGASYLVNKVEGTAGSVGGNSSQMPKGGSPLSDEEIHAIKDWIDAGALNN